MGIFGVRIGIYLTICLPAFVWGQIGGQHVYDFLRYPASARIGTLGGVNISRLDADPSMIFNNPASSNPRSHKQLGFTFSNQLADIRYGSTAYSQNVRSAGNFHAGVQFANYGNFRGADELNFPTGNFQAANYVFTAGFSRLFDKVRIGGSFNLITSYISTAHSTGLSLDMGALYADSLHRRNIGVTLRNFGGQINSYSDSDLKEKIPFEIQAGVTQGLEHLPLKLSLTFVHLNRFMQLLYVDPNAPIEYDLSGQEIPQKKRTFDKFARHLVIGAEFNFGKYVFFRTGYSHQRRQELKTLDHGGLAGFGVGGGIRISRLSFDYGFNNYHKASGVHQFSLSISLSPKSR